MNILLAVDGSEYTRRMLSFVASHEDWLGKNHRYTVVNSTPHINSRAASWVDESVLRSYYAEEAERIFEPIRTFFEARGIAASFVAQIGPVAEAVARQAKATQADLVMLGSHGHGNFMNLVMGSVATQVLASCTVPVLLIR